MPCFQTQEFQQTYAMALQEIFMPFSMDPTYCQLVFESAISGMFKKAGVPPAAIEWVDTFDTEQDRTQGLAIPKRWVIQLSRDTLTKQQDTVGKIKDMAIVYHEMRHIEQSWVMLLAVLANIVPTHQPMERGVIPTPIDSTCNPPEYDPIKSLPEKVTIFKNFYPASVVDKAIEMSFAMTLESELAIAWLARGLNEELFGGSALQRLHHHKQRKRLQSSRSNRTKADWQGRHDQTQFQKYIEEFAEAEAYEVEKQVRNTLRVAYAPTVFIPPVLTRRATSDLAENYLECIGPLLFNEISQSAGNSHKRPGTPLSSSDLPDEKRPRY
ncbi:Uncharacterised protein [BD1-7 clade bacterium]|nr:Uncharacterised protein [BD1-7 clade bacterium]